MEDLLQEVRKLPNIMGSFVFVEELGIAGSDLPIIFRGKDLDKFGRSINRIFTLSQTSELNVINIEIEYDEAKIFTKPIDDSSVILVIGEPASHPAMVKLTTSMLTSELKHAVETARLVSILPLPKTTDQSLAELFPIDHEQLSLPDQTALVQQPSSPTELPKPATEIVDAAALLEKGSLAEPLGRIENALAKTIGPFARIIMRENLEKWATAGPAVKERLQELADLLVVEIGNSKLEAQFRKEINPIIS